MPRLTLRTLLAYIDDTLEPDQARALGRKVAESQEAKQLIERIKKVTRRRGLHVPIPDGTDDDVSDPNTVAEYLSDNLGSEQMKELESTALSSDVHLAEVAACHQILTLVLTEPVRVPPSANQRMYKLVEPPASDHERKPGKAVPIGGVTPPPEHPEADDPDAALLLGMKRYGAADSRAGRLGLVGAVAAVAVFLVLALWMALPRAQPEPPETSREQYALATIPTPVLGWGLPVAPAPKPVGGPAKPEPPDGDKKEPVVDPGMMPPVDPKKEPGPVLGADPVKPPLAGRAVVGKMDTPNVIVLTRPPDPGSPWVRIDEKTADVPATDPVLALPGYKADVKLDTDVVVHLWGNLPEQVPMKAMVMQSRVRFHPPAAGFDADLTLEAGRIYLSTRKPNGAKIRVRFAGQTWDLALPNNMSEVLVQAHTAFVPGTRYAREGGEKPRTDARLVVVRGTADFNAPARFKKHEKLATWSEITWDSTSGALSEPKASPKEDKEAVKIPLLEGDQGKAIQRALSDAATKFTDRAGIRVHLEGRMNFAETRENVLPTMFAIYSYAAIADGPDTPTLVANLYDHLAERGREYARKAAVMAVSGWLPRDPGNTLTFWEVATTMKRLPEEEADLIARLLRGYSSRETRDTAALDELVGFLDHPNLIVREVALGNLLAFYGGATPELAALPVAARGEPGYDRALKAWKAWAEETKKKMMEKK